MSASNSKPAPVSTEDRAPYNAGDEEQVAARKKSAKETEVQRVEGLRHLVADANGRKWLWDLLDFCGVYRGSFTGNSTTFFNEGQRNVGLKLQADLAKHCPDTLVAMMKENA